MEEFHSKCLLQHACHSLEREWGRRRTGEGGEGGKGGEGPTLREQAGGPGLVLYPLGFGQTWGKWDGRQGFREDTQRQFSFGFRLVAWAAGALPRKIRLSHG